ncbi:hypothetical protein EJ06DRAFT_180609 [Trichodelitschia bisporula]|uniref:Uncharacterized protein n=1 Tax=Trichodelitschia bisporula TaxID=703511 RepID=A0A6G1HM69_9PEZI|nr:hypothetical protein EJ06DRAFT_180609 [Trichodelitschia bisporula]
MSTSFLQANSSIVYVLRVESRSRERRTTLLELLNRARAREESAPRTRTPPDHSSTLMTLLRYVLESEHHKDSKPLRPAINGPFPSKIPSSRMLGL